MKYLATADIPQFKDTTWSQRMDLRGQAMKRDRMLMLLWILPLPFYIAPVVLRWQAGLQGKTVSSFGLMFYLLALLGAWYLLEGFAINPRIKAALDRRQPD